MVRYIDADSLYEKLEKRYHQIEENYAGLDAQQYIMGFREAINILENEPGIDVQEVRHAKCVKDESVKEDCINNLLKSCPFCGADCGITYNYDKKFVPYCTNNDCFLNELDYGFDSEEDAKEAWNRRADDEQVR